MYIMINSHNTHYHTIVLQPKECVDKEPWTLRNIIDFFYEKPNFYINRCKTPGFKNKFDLVLTNNFTPVDISKYERYYEQNFQLPKPTEEEMKRKWSLKDFMIKCYELDLKEYDEEISAKTLISVTKDALRIDSMKSAGVVGQHSLTRKEFIDAFFLLDKDDVLDLNISVGIFTDRDENICAKVKPIDIRLQYKIKRSGFEEKNDESSWDKIFRINKMEYNSEDDKDEEERLIKLTTIKHHYFQKGDYMKISGIIVKPEPIKVNGILNHNSFKLMILESVWDADKLADKINVDMVVKHKFLKMNTFVKSINTTAQEPPNPCPQGTICPSGDYIEIELTRPAEVNLNDPNGYEISFCDPPNPFYIKNPVVKDTAIIMNVTEDTVTVKSRFDITKFKEIPEKDDDGCPVKLEITELGLPEEYVSIRKLFTRGEKCKLEYTGP